MAGEQGDQEKLQPGPRGSAGRSSRGGGRRAQEPPAGETHGKSAEGFAGITQAEGSALTPDAQYQPAPPQRSKVEPGGRKQVFLCPQRERERRGALGGCLWGAAESQSWRPLEGRVWGPRVC